MAIEKQEGGFSAIYPVLREMEEAGRVRRGHFVHGMTSAQFAMPGAVDRLRALRNADQGAKAVLLAATDPAQPYGVLLEWPETSGASGRPRRAVGASVVLVDGSPALFIDGGGKRVLTFLDEAMEPGSMRLERALRALVAGIVRLGTKRLAIEEIDGEKARSSGLAEALVDAGFRLAYRGFEIDRPPGSDAQAR
jgi:ATP-dependent Lhr-like helicase